MAHTASAAIGVAGAPSVVWQHLTDGALLSRWFADSGDLSPDGAFRFEFGDGDYFTGRVVGWDAPRELKLQWRFMGIGPQFDIALRLAPTATGTEVAVTDHGSRTADDAAGLVEGWRDFLERLQRCVATGQPSRYEWSQTIGTAALSPLDSAAVRSLLRDAGWWREHFPGVDATIVLSGDRQLIVDFQTATWGKVRPRAVVTLEDDSGGTYIGVTHAGFADLPEASRVGERRRVAAMWGRALAGLEAR